MLPVIKRKTCLHKASLGHLSSDLTEHTPLVHPALGLMQEAGEDGEPVSYGPKVCSLCGVEKELEEFGPKKGSKDGKDCYCRICGSLRRRYTIPVRPARLFCAAMQRAWHQQTQQREHALLSQR